MATFHVLYLPSPIALYILCVHTSCQIDEMEAMVYSGMSCNSGQGSYPAVQAPLVQVNDGSSSSVGLNKEV